MSFNFGGTTTASGGGFSFGGGQASASAPATSGGFSFGGAGSGGAAFGPAPAPTPASTGFSFGGAPAPAPAAGTGGFSFGGTSTPAPAPAAGGFSFGGAPAPAPAAGGFSFGGAPAPAPAAGGFSFGGAAPAPTAVGFNLMGTGQQPGAAQQQQPQVTLETFLPPSGIATKLPDVESEPVSTFQAWKEPLESRRREMEKKLQPLSLQSVHEGTRALRHSLRRLEQEVLRARTDVTREAALARKAERDMGAIREDTAEGEALVRVADDAVRGVGSSGGRGAPLPARYFERYLSDARQRMETCRAKIEELDSVLRGGGGAGPDGRLDSGRVGRVDGPTLHAALRSQHEAFLWVAGRVAELHSQISSIKEEFLARWRRGHVQARSAAGAGQPGYGSENPLEEVARQEQQQRLRLDQEYEQRAREFEVLERRKKQQEGAASSAASAPATAMSTTTATTFSTFAPAPAPGPATPALQLGNFTTSLGSEKKKKKKKSKPPY